MNTGIDDPRLAAEQRARVLIDRQFCAAGWSVRDKKDLNLFAAEGVACREAVMKSGHGRADYLLYVDKQVVGVIEAKPEGTTLRASSGSPRLRHRPATRSATALGHD